MYVENQTYWRFKTRKKESRMQHRLSIAKKGKIGKVNKMVCWTKNLQMTKENLGLVNGI